MRILSGIQPSGDLHIGNYFGALKQHVEMQDQGEGFYFIATYHALTTLQDAPRLRALTFDVAASYLALGLDPNRAVLFRQTDVPEVTELCWILSTVTGTGLLERGTSYKDKVARGIESNAGLFLYPVLQAADILIYDSDQVPVGRDQIQHIEFCRDMAGYLNGTYGEGLLKQPTARLSPTPIVPGIDGQKMSKSYGNVLPIFEGGKALRKRVMNIVTDSKGLDDPKDPETCNVFALYRLFADATEQAEMAARYRAGGYGYGHAKQALFDKMDAYFAEARERKATLVAHPSDVEDVLVEGGRRARAVAAATMDRVRHAVGLR